MAIGKKLKSKLDKLHTPYTVGLFVTNGYVVYQIVNIQPDSLIPSRNEYTLKYIIEMYEGEYTIPTGESYEKVYHIDKFSIVTLNDMLARLENEYKDARHTMKSAFNTKEI